MNPATATGTVSLVTQLGRVIYRRATEEVIGMRLKQLIALDHLRANDSCLQQGLGQMLMLDPNNCVLLLNELDKAGYVERLRDPTDRRRHIVQITPEGRRALEQAEGKLEALEGEVLGNLDQTERRRLHDLLAKALDGQEEPLERG
ncbi:MAG TPA: MarR family winged helix-turn-helix transcriptional regulator [Solirubrobacterales bacterium]|nr:MarR family winged helix-turn-helix transcriptional regulator [Solirubrobacterales bacterium]